MKHSRTVLKSLTARIGLLLGIALSPSAWAMEECKIVLTSKNPHTQGTCDGITIFRTGLDGSNHSNVHDCNKFWVPKDKDGFDRLGMVVGTWDHGSIDPRGGTQSGVFMHRQYTFGEKGELLAVYANGHYEMVGGMYAVRCYRKSNHSFLADNTWRRSHGNAPGRWGSPVECTDPANQRQSIGGTWPTVPVTATVPAPAANQRQSIGGTWQYSCNYAKIPLPDGATVAKTCPGQKRFNDLNGQCECQTAECCEKGTKFDAVAKRCDLVSPTGAGDIQENFATTIQTGFATLAQQTGYDSNNNEYGFTANRDLMTAGGSLADQGLIAKTVETSASAGGGTVSEYDPTRLAGGLVTTGSGDKSDQKNGSNGANGGTLLSLSGMGSDSGDVSLASITGSDGSYQFRGGATAGSGGNDGSGGARFAGSEIGGGPSVSNNGQTPNMEFGGSRGLASANGAMADGQSGGRVGEDPLDYFTRIGLGDDIFKIVEKRYRSQQTGWVLNAPAVKK